MSPDQLLRKPRPQYKISQKLWLCAFTLLKGNSGMLQLYFFLHFQKYCLYLKTKQNELVMKIQLHSTYSKTTHYIVGDLHCCLIKHMARWCFLDLLSFLSLLLRWWVFFYLLAFFTYIYLAKEPEKSREERMFVLIADCFLLLEGSVFCVKPCYLSV